MFFILVAAFLSLQDWRRGIFFMMLIAAVQDPIRKMIPGAPGYLTLSIMPVWFSMIFKAMPFLPGYRNEFRLRFPQLTSIVRMFILSIIPAAFISATYGPGSWQITLIGLIFYSSLFFGVLFGYMFTARDHTILQRALIFYCVLTAFMLIGTPLEYWGRFHDVKALGTSAFDAVWIRYTGRGMVKLISGFYRSPDIMGWHSVTLTMLSLLLALQSKGKKRYFWIGLAGWGVVGVMLCGRRKMIYMLPIYGFVLSWLMWRVQSHRFQFKKMVVVILLGIFAGYGIYGIVGPSSDVEQYYFKAAGDDPIERFKKEGLSALIGTYQQSGFWGEGLGTATQGIHHLKVARPRTWQEGGLSKVLVELGVPGFLGFVLVFGVMIKSIWTLVSVKLDKNSPNFIFWGGLFAVLCGNSVAFVVSGQIYGDPFIIIFISFISGVILSSARSVGQTAEQEYKVAASQGGLMKRIIRPRV
jgi:hypothetical protein